MLRTIVESIADGLVVVTQDGVVRYANAAAEALFGRPRNELVGRVFGYPMTDAEIGLPSVSGHVRKGDMRVADAEWDGQPAHVATIRDVSGSAHLRAVQWRVVRSDKRATLARLSSKIAHEVNNPAAFMLANLTVIRDIIADFEALFDEAHLNPALLSKYQIEQSLADMREMLEDNESGIGRIRGLIRELQALTRDDVDVVETVDVNQIAGLACQLTAELLPDRSRLVREFGQPPNVALDGFKLLIILVNLIDNAARALDSSDGAQGTITVTTDHTEDSVSVAVRDTGCGIEERHRDHIFRPFFVARAEGHNTSGLGLGLAVVKELCAAQGGRIELKSEVGQGSSFRLVFPATGDRLVSESSDLPATEIDRDA